MRWFLISNPNSNRNTFSLQVDDWTNSWYHGKNLPQRQQILNEIRSFLKHRRLAEQDPNPDIASLRSEITSLESEQERYQSSLREIETKISAFNARIDEIESKHQADEEEEIKRVQHERRELKKQGLMRGIDL